MSNELDRLIAAGIARPPIATIFPLDRFVEAMLLAQSGTSAGRVLLKMPAADHLEAAHPRARP
jgi:NADPH:quinone reductase-like Zn-dependent oxidoreductase